MMTQKDLEFLQKTGDGKSLDGDGNFFIWLFRVLIGLVLECPNEPSRREGERPLAGRILYCGTLLRRDRVGR